MKRHPDHQHQPQTSDPCGVCGSSERWVLHSVRHRASYRRLCTDCVLKNHQALFCSICLVVFDHNSSPFPPPSERTICVNCPSVAHVSCLPNHFSPPFQCPSCSNPNFSFFNSLPNKRLKSDVPDLDPVTSEPAARVVDKDSAKALLAAARIAATSMTKAAAAARLDAERRVKEATLAKKKAKEALERLAFLALKEKEKEKEKEKKDKHSKGVVKENTNGIVKRDPENGQSVDCSVQGVKASSNGLHSVSPAASAGGQLRNHAREN